MSDRPTPETDEQINGKPCTSFFVCAGDTLRDALVPSEFARKLERERDEAREEWGKASMDAAQLLSEKTYVIAERDEAREMQAKALRERESTEREVDAMLERAIKAEQERDEAIAARKASAADWLGQVDQANARVSQALQQVALAQRERDEARAELEMWRDGNIMHEIHRDELEEAKRNAGIRVTDKIPNENYHPQYGGTSLL